MKKVFKVGLICFLLSLFVLSTIELDVYASTEKHAVKPPKKPAIDSTAEAADDSNNSADEADDSNNTENKDADSKPAAIVPATVPVTAPIKSTVVPIAAAEKKIPATATASSPAVVSLPVTAPHPRISANLVTKDPTIRIRTVTVKRNQGFSQILSSLGFSQRQVTTLIQRLAIEGGFNANSARIGQEVILAEKTEGNKRKLLGIKIPTDNYIIRISKDNVGYIQINKELRKDAPSEAKSRYMYKSGIIVTNIDAYASKHGVPQAVMDKAVRVLSGRISVNQIQQGAKLDILYEYTYNNAGHQTGVRLVYVGFSGKGQNIEGYRFSPDGKDNGEFFDATGNSYTKSMLSSPLRGKHKITSPFGYRTHPILGRRMLHTGVDFSAKRGEAVYAAGDGTIDKIGREGGYGNFVRIKHDDTWSTAYAHMTAYARGMYKWKRVKKGELIGYVGNTGRSTGPHLHFELQKNGTPIDPLRAKLPLGGKKLIAKDLYNFRQEVIRMKGIISQSDNAR